MGKRILVCGGRDYNDRRRVYEVLDAIHLKCVIDVVIQGAARGADSLAGEWARDRNVKCEIFPANWSKYGKSAGFRRNEQMLFEGKPDGVVAFPGGKGTRMMIELSKRNKVRVMEIGE